MLTYRMPSFFASASSDAHQPVLGFLADHVDGVTPSDLPKESMQP